MRKLLLITSLFLFSAVNLYALPAEAPEDVIIEVFNKGLKILSNPELQGDEHKDERRRQLWEFAKDHFYPTEMSRRALGHQWKTLTDEQQKQFTEAFTTVLKNFYLGKTDTYRGENIKYVRKVSKGRRVRVQTELTTEAGGTYRIDFSLIDHENVWKAYDITIEGVSIVSNYRSQFNNILSTKGFDHLMEQLQEKLEDQSDEE